MIQFAKNFALEPAVGYSQKGARYTDDSNGKEMLLNYVDFKVMAAALLPVTGGFRIKLFAGPCANYLRSASFKRYGRLWMSSVDLGGLDLGISGGVGADWVLPFGLLTADVRYEHGFSTIVATVGVTEDARNRVLTTSLGFAY